MKEETRSSYETRVRGAVAQIAASLDEALNLAELARAAALSPLHFHRIFRSLVGETALELHRRLRLERAAFRLAQTDLKVASIASDAGYETHESFTRSFREAYVMSPSEFRTRAREAAEAGTAQPRIPLSARCGVHFDDPRPADVRLAIPGAEPSMQIVVEDLPERRVAAISHVGPYHTLMTAFDRLSAILGPSALWRMPGAALVTIYHDDYESTPRGELRSDAGLLVPEDAPIPKGLLELRIPAGRYARTTHIGAHGHLADVWPRFVGEWSLHGGQRIADGPMYDVYRNLSRVTRLEELRTDLHLPIE